MSRYHLALWVLLAGKLLGAWGLTWDIQWHLLIGRDTFWIPPHVMMYGGVTGGLLVAFTVLALDTYSAQRGTRPRGAITILGLTSTRGIHLATWGVALLILAAPIDARMLPTRTHSDSGPTFTTALPLLWTCQAISQPSASLQAIAFCSCFTTCSKVWQSQLCRTVIQGGATSVPVPVISSTSGVGRVRSTMP